MKLSHWHDGKVKPVHVGVYEVQPEEYKYYSYFDGSKWRGHWRAIETAFYNSNFEYKGSKTTQWRGVVK